MTMRMLSVSLLLCAVMALTTAVPTAVKNVARGGQAAQSSVYQGGIPERAIDGNRASVWSQNSCTHTNKDTRPWWSVDLRKIYTVRSVKITNRRGSAERINGAEIRIGTSLNDNGNGNPRCAVIDSIPAGYTRTFNCNGMEGQFVNIVIPTRAEYLTLCEVEVFGTEKEDDDPPAESEELFKGPWSCSFCEKFFKSVLQIVGNGTSKEAITNALNTACSRLGAFKSNMCKTFVRMFIPIITEVIETHGDSQAICAKMRLCDGAFTNAELAFMDMRLTASEKDVEELKKQVAVLCKLTGHCESSTQDANN